MKNAKSATMILALTLATMVGCATTPPVAVQSTGGIERPPDVKGMVKGNWYKDFLSQHNRRPVVEVLTAGKYGSRKDLEREEKRINGEIGKARPGKVSRVLANVPENWRKCLSNYSVQRLFQYSLGHGNRPVPRSEIYQNTGLLTRACIAQVNVNELQKEAAREKQIKKAAMSRHTVVMEGRQWQTDLIRSGKVRVVSVGDRGILSAERYFSMSHSKRGISQPAEVTGADYLLEVSRSDARLIRIENNEIVWSENGSN